MASLNKIMLIGNLGADPETKFLPDGTQVTNLRLATTEKWVKNGEKVEHTEWHRVVFFGRQAEIAAQYLHKGEPAFIEGRIRTQKWIDKETQQERSRVEVSGDRLQLLGLRPKAEPAPAAKPTAAQNYKDKGAGTTHPRFADMEDDIPF